MEENNETRLPDRIVYNEESDSYEVKKDRRIGKFDSPESLLKAYESLRREFTKRCQRLKELERENEELVKNESDKERLTARFDELLGESDFVDTHILPRENIKSRIIDEYLLALRRASSSLPGILDSRGSSALTPPGKPKNLADAKRLADILLNS